MDERREHPDGPPPPVGPAAEWGDRQRSMQNIWRIRWVLMALSFVLAVALIASGAVFIGVLLAAVAGVRLTMMLMWRRRRRELGRRRRGEGTNGP